MSQDHGRPVSDLIDKAGAEKIHAELHTEVKGNQQGDLDRGIP